MPMLHLLFIESSSNFESKHWHNRPVLQHHNNNPKHPVQNHLQFMIFLLSHFVLGTM
ncbi:hypothetical protein RO3G_07358 [Rhizopus delemar RA 99-880]|uniref:Uncharacterized protein n=1 Tax=Rhizopus delemar (strain RA 99-880 / ATCC MYA-4621 / FGSC 9543 / NRRL 43880) TaxID=246409 RepID=I1C2H3_RHIO9|nr:hypothetical protein RO3G_07358 [Rhizopus delemar RA 99-880]|eukprot:EIE82653.1 hypothetical protein RO3G_07358 [Rhizopus delemar RA 99-880]